MGLDEVKFLKSINPIQFIEKPSKQSIELVARFINDPGFKELTNTLRSTYNFPKEGVDLTPFTGKNYDDIPIQKVEQVRYSLKVVANRLAERMNIEGDLGQQLYLLVFHNSIIDTNFCSSLFSNKVDYAVTRKDIVCKMFDYKHEVAAIIIPYNIKFEEFKKQTKKIWNQLQEKMSENLTDDPYELKIHQNTELAMRITMLKEQEGLSFSQIAEKLYLDSDGSNEKLRSEEYIKDIYYDNKKFWNSPIHNKQKVAKK